MIYKINKETQEVLQQYTNVINWSADFVEYTSGSIRVKEYCSENEMFVDTLPTENIWQKNIC